MTPGANAVLACPDTVLEPVWNNNQSGKAWSGRGSESNSAHNSSNVYCARAVHVQEYSLHLEFPDEKTNVIAVLWCLARRAHQKTLNQDSTLVTKMEKN